MRILVCGGRNYQDLKQVARALDPYLTSSLVIIHGGAKGADRLAGMWAEAAGVPVEVYNADWAKYGKAAGVLRNQQMLDESKPDTVIAFAGGRGTFDMIRRARSAGIKVIFPLTSGVN